MKAANYALIRYLADSARDEPLNIGVLLWDNEQYLLRLDDAAIQRVIRFNPHLDREALDFIESFLSDSLLQDWPGDPDEVARFLAHIDLGPVLLTGPRFGSYDEEDPEAFASLAERLLARLVRPRHRSPEVSREPGTMRYFRSRFSPLIQAHAVTKDFPFAVSRSGVLRSVSFYTNSGADTAFDVLPIALASERSVQERVDAEAGKVYDILSANDLRAFLVYCDMNAEDRTGEPWYRVQQILVAAGAIPIMDRDEAADAFEEVANRNR